jgi:hypothetical protein
MTPCPTSNMNRSQLWGFEVSHIIASFIVLAISNVLLRTVGLPVLTSWLFCLGTLCVLRLISHGQKNGHLELLFHFVAGPHVFLGHQERSSRE